MTIKRRGFLGMLGVGIGALVVRPRLSESETATLPTSVAKQGTGTYAFTFDRPAQFVLLQWDGKRWLLKGEG
jgi:hypothetical protein